jgi:hypothetical protein
MRPSKTLKISADLHDSIKAFTKDEGLVLQVWVKKALLSVMLNQKQKPKKK